MGSCTRRVTFPAYDWGRYRAVGSSRISRLSRSIRIDSRACEVALTVEGNARTIYRPARKDLDETTRASMVSRHCRPLLDSDS